MWGRERERELERRAIGADQISVCKHFTFIPK